MSVTLGYSCHTAHVHWCLVSRAKTFASQLC